MIITIRKRGVFPSAALPQVTLPGRMGAHLKRPRRHDWQIDFGPLTFYPYLRYFTISGRDSVIAAGKPSWSNTGCGYYTDV